MWVSNIPKGPSAKFLVENGMFFAFVVRMTEISSASSCRSSTVHTMEEMRLTGNCLKGSRPLLSFDASFEKHPHYSLLKELFIQVSIL